MAATGPVGIGQAAKLPGQTKPGTPGPQSTYGVVKGENGWLYLAGEFASACHPAWSIDQVPAGVLRLEAIIRASGRRMILAVPPDKSNIERAEVPDDYAFTTCADRAHRARIAALRRLDPPGFVDVEAILRARERSQGHPIYLALDSHWSDTAAVLFGRSIAREIDPRLLRHTRVERVNEAPRDGDLTKLLADPRPIRQRALRIVRDGVSAPLTTSWPLYSGALVGRDRRTGSPGGAALYPRRTVISGTSFTGVSYTKLYPYFADITRSRDSWTPRRRSGSHETSGCSSVWSSARSCSSSSRSNASSGAYERRASCAPSFWIAWSGPSSARSDARTHRPQLARAPVRRPSAGAGRRANRRHRSWGRCRGRAG